MSTGTKLKQKAMRMYMYILIDRHPVSVEDVFVWAMFMEGNRTVEKQEVGGVEISTAFLGIDYTFGHGEPLLFETMIFGGDHDGYQRRYETWDEAIEGHRRAVELVQRQAEADKIISTVLNKKEHE